MRNGVGEGGLSGEFVVSVHREIDALRRSKGLSPWKWKEDEAMRVHAFRERGCECGCGERFTPLGARQIFAKGHRPRTVVREAPAKVEKTPRVIGAKAPERQTPALDYRLALATAEAELRQLERSIDDADNEMEGFRAAIASMQMVKDKAVERHALVSDGMVVLQLLAGIPVAADLEAA